jgi:archaellum biogenesis ATPase FlaH
MAEKGNLFTNLVNKRDDSDDLVQCMKNTVDNILKSDTSSQKPGILLGKIQSGKTRAFIGIMALAFDNGYDVAIILTKGTKALVQQTMQRLERDFEEPISNDEVDIFNIMVMPDNLTAYERGKKIIIVVKKEVNNMRRIIDKLASVYPDLREKKILIVDDEADYASISFRKHAEAVEIGRISSQIDELRNIVEEVSYLQVTATPYSLYLQPSTAEERMEFLPKRPAFTVLLPIHKKYVGGEFYFRNSDNENSVAHDVFEEVSSEEREVLKEPDARKLKLEDVLSSRKIIMLRKATMNFLVGSVIRRIQQKDNNLTIKKYAFVAHSETGRNSHDWQFRVISELISEFTRVATNNDQTLFNLIRDSYLDITSSIAKLDNLKIPDLDSVNKEIIKALIEEHIMITTVNSDKEVEELLDNLGQLKLRNPMNIFIGGQLLDRGVTINNLIGFYYGRKPKKFQQDTVLQHARMYGARPIEDLSVTRFYTTWDIYEIMKNIHEFDSSLREAFEKGDHSNGIYFIRKDPIGRLVPCSPNKLLLSSLTTLRPYKRMLPVGFQTGYKTNIKNIIEQVDEEIRSWFKGLDENKPVLVPLQSVTSVIDLISHTLELNSSHPFNWKTMKASLEHLSLHSKNTSESGKVWILVRRNRDAKRIRESGRYENAPDTPKREGVLAREVAITCPVMMLFRQNGNKNDGWRDYTFWWPVLMSPKRTEVAVFAEDTI